LVTLWLAHYIMNASQKPLLFKYKINMIKP
jgi:hypothetical protein